jgi:branched-chain amino acid transport system permease protein
MVDPVLLAQLVVNGVSVGAIYGLVALGLVLTYKATEVLNFAQGDLLVVAAFVGWGLIAVVGVPYVVAVPITIAVVAALAWGIEAGVVRRIAGQPQFSGVMLTIALAFMLRGLVSMVFGPDSRALPTPFAGQTLWIGPVAISVANIVVIVSAGVLTALSFVALKATTLGVAIQAASQNQLAAYLSGIPVKRLNALVWAGAGAIAAACGLLLAPIALVDLSLWTVLLKALAAMVLGGFGSIPGALVGGLVIGLVEQFSGVFLPDGVKDIAAYVVLIAVLVFYPRGLFGEAHGRRV